MIKKIKENTKAEMGIATLAVIAILVIIVGIVLWPTIFPTTPGKDLNASKTPSLSQPGGKIFQGDVTLKIKNWNSGSPIASNSNVSVYLVPADQYSTIYDARKDLDEQGGLVSPYNPKEFASADTPDSNGEVQLTARALSEENGGTTYGIYVHDASTDTASPDASAPTTGFGDMLSKVKLEGHYDSAGAQVVSSLITPGFVGPDVTLAAVGNMSIYDNQNGVYDRTNFTRVFTADSSNVQQSVDFHLRLNNNYAKAKNIGVYVEEVDNVVGTAALDINEMVITLPDGTKHTVSLKKVSDYPSTSAIQKNAPAASSSGTSTMWFASWTGSNGEAVNGFNLQRISGTRYDDVAISFTDFDVDFSAATTSDQANIVMHFVSWNGYKDSDIQSLPFTFILGENATATPAGWN